MKTKKFYQRALSFMLALTMIVTVFAIAPTEVSAASKTKQFKGKKSTVTITDKECYDKKGDLAEHYIKFKAPSTGTITLKFKTSSKSTKTTLAAVRLCNKSKKPLGLLETVTTQYKDGFYYTRSYGVKKGQTYYFEMAATSGVKISHTFTTIKKASATSANKAKKIAKGKTMKGVILAGDNKAEWYKISVDEDKKMKMVCTAKTNGIYLGNDSKLHVGAGIKFTYYVEDKGKIDIFDSKNPSDILTVDFPKQTSTFSVRWDDGGTHTLYKGNYYVKVEPANQYSSGEFSIKWSMF